MRFRQWAWGAALLLMATVAQAGGPGEVRKQVEASLLVTGSVDIERDGSVSGFALDHADRLPTGVRELADRTIPTWKFEPVMLQGASVKARARMSLRVVAKKVEQDRYDVTIKHASFGQTKPGEHVTAGTMAPPKYPELAARSAVKGDVFLVIKIGRDGRVMEAFAEQVNLRTIDDETGMKRWRAMFAQAATRGAMAWTFVPPTTGEEVDKPYWSARVPVSFVFHDEKPQQYGQWQAYVPGPRETAPWVRDDKYGSDALVAGGVYPLGAGPRLLTSLNPG